ncbi:MAG: hypothetical protein U0166_11700 [Acidobacteriota bacterium]
MTEHGVPLGTLMIGLFTLCACLGTIVNLRAQRPLVDGALIVAVLVAALATVKLAIIVMLSTRLGWDSHRRDYHLGAAVGEAALPLVAGALISWRFRRRRTAWNAARASAAAQPPVR